MRLTWFGQSAFHLVGEQGSVFIDPFGDMSGAAARGIEFGYPPIGGVTADVLLVTHEHGDHNGVTAIGGSPATVRATAGTHDSSLGQIIGIASEHDPAAGTQRGPNTIFAFTLDGHRVVHFGDFGQTSLRREQADAIGNPDLLFLPVGGGPTIGAGEAWEIVDRLRPRWVVPMHYRTGRVNFLEPLDAFLETAEHVHSVDSPTLDTADLPSDRSPLVVVPAAP
jgi:L-ascorbate metabolism protein UlaG (beta-lactamase superfamily)